MSLNYNNGSYHGAFEDLPNFTKIFPVTSAIPPGESGMVQFPMLLSDWSSTTLAIIYAAILLFGVVGNCFVLVVITNVKRMVTVTNYFIFNLAIADLLLITFCLVPHLIANVFFVWSTSSILCNVASYAQAISGCASAYFLLVVSLDRCLAIDNLNWQQLSKERSKQIIQGIWIFSSIMGLPWALLFHTGRFTNLNLKFCDSAWLGSSMDYWRKHFFLLYIFLSYCLPLGLILICYLIIFIRVYRKPISSNSHHKTVQRVRQRSETAVMKMLLIVILIFAMSWMPLYGILIRLNFGPNILSDSELSMVSTLCGIQEWLLCFNSSINPFIYPLFNHKFARAFAPVLCKYVRRRDRVQIRHVPQTNSILPNRLHGNRVVCNQDVCNRCPDSL